MRHCVWNISPDNKHHNQKTHEQNCSMIMWPDSVLLVLNLCQCYSRNEYYRGPFNECFSATADLAPLSPWTSEGRVVRTCGPCIYVYGTVTWVKIKTINMIKVYMFRLHLAGHWLLCDKNMIKDNLLSFTLMQNPVYDMFLIITRSIVTAKTFGLLPDQGWIWLHFPDFKHDYIKEVYRSDMCFVGRGLRTSDFRGDWQHQWGPKGNLSQCQMGQCIILPGGH